MKKIFTITILLFTLFYAKAQEDVIVAIGAGYSNQNYYTINDNTQTLLANDSWDLAFETGIAKAGIHYNESVGISFTGTVPSLQMCLAPTTDFEEIFSPEDIIDTIFNSEINWADGAFNTVKDATDPYDFGWGLYNSTTHDVNALRIFALKLRDDSWKKIEITSLSNGVWTMKYANLDGSNEYIITLDKTDYSDSPLILFSFENNEPTASPAGWDLVFQRYTTAIPIGGGQFLDYTVMGILSADGIEVAKALDVDPSTVDVNDYLDDYSSNIDGIGYDWKSFDLNGGGWVVDQSRVYFVKTLDNHIWKLYFYDFSGSSVGETTFEKEDLGLINTIVSPTSNFSDFGVFPNPIRENFTITFSLKQQRSNLNIQLINTLGQIVWHKQIKANEKLNILNINTPNITSGLYQLVIGSDLDIISTPIIIE